MQIIWGAKGCCYNVVGTLEGFWFKRRSSYVSNWRQSRVQSRAYIISNNESNVCALLENNAHLKSLYRTITCRFILFASKRLARKQDVLKYYVIWYQDKKYTLNVIWDEFSRWFDKLFFCLPTPLSKNIMSFVLILKELIAFSESLRSVSTEGSRQRVVILYSDKRVIHVVCLWDIAHHS